VRRANRTGVSTGPPGSLAHRVWREGQCCAVRSPEGAGRRT